MELETSMITEPPHAYALTRLASLYEVVGALRWSRSRVYARTADLVMALTVAALPWSTTATAVFVILWLIMIVPTVDWDEFVRELAHPALALPLLFFGLADIGILWSDGMFGQSLHGLNSVSKLLLIPFLLYHFARAERTNWVLVAFLGSCTLLMLLSWIVAIDPSFKLSATASRGVPVKNYIDQSHAFTLCAFVLAWLVLAMVKQR